ncbi:hypothetical protein [uncultured Paraglaciecola sp.]|uniref:hypothetical protein n=1 Tax=uncultured Paraglaciecola sp. TaxID=1765024 RepID=UPI0026085743|nr:hypothetical protein [uncultured Paraglaciecola sp.]
MEILNPNWPESARNNHSKLLQAVSANATYDEIATELGASKATVSRLITEHSEAYHKLLALMGFKVVPHGHECHSKEYLDSLRFFALRGVEQDVSGE